MVKLPEMTISDAKAADKMLIEIYAKILIFGSRVESSRQLRFFST